MFKDRARLLITYHCTPALRFTYMVSLHLGELVI